MCRKTERSKPAPVIASMPSPLALANKSLRANLFSRVAPGSAKLFPKFLAYGYFPARQEIFFSALPPG